MKIQVIQNQNYQNKKQVSFGNVHYLLKALSQRPDVPCASCGKLMIPKELVTRWVGTINPYTGQRFAEALEQNKKYFRGVTYNCAVELQKGAKRLPNSYISVVAENVRQNLFPELGGNIFSLLLRVSKEWSDLVKSNSLNSYKQQVIIEKLREPEKLCENPLLAKPVKTMYKNFIKEAVSSVYSKRSFPYLRIVDKNGRALDEKTKATLMFFNMSGMTSNKVLLNLIKTATPEVENISSKKFGKFDNQVLVCQHCQRKRKDVNLNVFSQSQPNLAKNLEYFLDYVASLLLDGNSSFLKNIIKTNEERFRLMQMYGNGLAKNIQESSRGKIKLNDYL